MLKMKFPVLPDLSFYVLTPTTAAQCELHNVSVWKAYKSQKRVEITDKKKTLCLPLCVCFSVCVCLDSFGSCVVVGATVNQQIITATCA